MMQLAILRSFVEFAFEFSHSPARRSCPVYPLALATLEQALHVSAQKLGISPPKQELSKRSFVAGRDVFVSLPTGYGKSACYQRSMLLRVSAVSCQFT